jgi:hypothetical protein
MLIPTTYTSLVGSTLSRADLIFALAISIRRYLLKQLFPSLSLLGAHCVLIQMQLGSFLGSLGAVLGPYRGSRAATSTYNLVSPIPSSILSFVFRACTSSCSSIF